MLLRAGRDSRAITGFEGYAVPEALPVRPTVAQRLHSRLSQREVPNLSAQPLGAIAHPDRHQALVFQAPKCHVHRGYRRIPASDFDQFEVHVASGRSPIQTREGEEHGLFEFTEMIPRADD